MLQITKGLEQTRSVRLGSDSLYHIISEQVEQKLTNPEIKSMTLYVDQEESGKLSETYGWVLSSVLKVLDAMDKHSYEIRDVTSQISHREVKHQVYGFSVTIGWNRIVPRLRLE